MRITAHQEEQTGLVAKALAIGAVILLHLIALYPETLFTSNPHHDSFIILNQLLRFCVPLFLVLSGFGLSRKYFAKKPPIKEFLVRRFSKLLPLYLLWSILIAATLIALQSWHPVLAVDWWQHLLLGSVDYHLYFVLLIVQCYLVFAALPYLGRRMLLGLLVVSGITQLLWYVGIRQLEFGEFTAFPAMFFSLEKLPEKFLQDQVQYRLLVNWLFYFIGGVWLGQLNLDRVRSSASIALLTFIVCVFGAVWMIQDAFFLIEELGVTTYALGFIRPSVMFYASAVSVAAVVYAPLLAAAQWPRQLRFGSRFSFSSLLTSIGTHSYLIFLSHTIGLRVIAEFLNVPGSPGVRLSAIVVGSVSLAIGLALSRSLLR